jgi:hypothetical protein
VLWRTKKKDIHVCKTVGEVKKILDRCDDILPVCCGFDDNVVLLFQQRIEGDEETGRFRVAFDEDDGTHTH